MGTDLSPHQRFADAMAALGDNAPRRQAVVAMQTKAIGYVWGWQDAGGDVRDPEQAFEFGYAYGTVVALYKLEKVPAMPSIRDAWQSWREHDEIREHSGRVLDQVSPK